MTTYLNTNEKKGLELFTSKVKKLLRGNLISIRLFGSKIRGDFTEESDIDLLLVLKENIFSRNKWHIYCSIVTWPEKEAGNERNIIERQQRGHRAGANDRADHYRPHHRSCAPSLLRHPAAEASEGRRHGCRKQNEVREDDGGPAQCECRALFFPS